MPPSRYPPPLISARTYVGVVATLLFLGLYTVVTISSKKALSLTHTSQAAGTWAQLSTSHSSGQRKEREEGFRSAGWGGYMTLSEKAKFPNQGRNKDFQGVDPDSGSRSQYYGLVQRDRQEWLRLKIQELMSPPSAAAIKEAPAVKGDHGTTTSADDEDEEKRMLWDLDDDEMTDGSSRVVPQMHQQLPLDSSGDGLADKGSIHKSVVTVVGAIGDAGEAGQEPAVASPTDVQRSAGAKASSSREERQQLQQQQQHRHRHRQQKRKRTRRLEQQHRQRQQQEAPPLMTTLTPRRKKGEKEGQSRSVNGDSSKIHEEGTKKTAAAVTKSALRKEKREHLPQHPQVSGPGSESDARFGSELPTTASSGGIVVAFPPLGGTQHKNNAAFFAGDRGIGGDEVGGDTASSMVEERVRRMRIGAELWGATYVPPIEPGRRNDLMEKWSGWRKGGGDEDEAVEENGEIRAVNIPVGAKGGDRGRILYVISSFDRGKRLGPTYAKVDKLDYILMMMDETREACEAGFSPQVHFIAAWDPSEITEFVRDRLFCKRTNSYVPYSYEQHPSNIGNNLSIKHRIYMKSRLEKFDIFLQVEDDMILTLNHIVLYQEESERLAYRRGPQSRPDYHFVPGFIRVEPKEGGGDKGRGEEWFEWEILLSRVRPKKVAGGGTYLTLGGSRVLKNGGNNQGLWMATREQLGELSARCEYLNFDVKTSRAHVETHSGSIQMFSPKCNLQKVFPASRFEDYLVHHRTNNKNGRSGESIPAVPISMLRTWVEQFLRDEMFLEELL